MIKVTKNYMENVLKKLIRDIDAKEYEWCSGGMQIKIALDREEASFLLEAVERLEGKNNE